MEKLFTSFPHVLLPGSKLPDMFCDVIDEGKQFKIQANVPGIKKNEIDLNVTDNAVEISAEHKEESEDKKKNYLKKERSHVSSYRTISLSEKVVSGKTRAKLVDGVLTVTLQKAKPTPAQKKRSISV